MPADPVVHVTDEDGGVRVLTLDRPPANALDHQLLVELEEATAAAENEPDVRSIVLTGEARSSVPASTSGRRLASPTRSRRWFGLPVGAPATPRAPKPTVALVNGHAIAGGLVLALACDHRFTVTGDHRIGVNEVARAPPTRQPPSRSCTCA